MAAAWTAPCRRLVVDRGARSTLANASRPPALPAGGRHARSSSSRPAGTAGARASSARSAARPGHGSAVATTAEPATRSTGLRELAAWTVVPLLALVAARTR